jgi:hypothetical protein
MTNHTHGKDEMRRGPQLPRAFVTGQWTDSPKQNTHKHAQTEPACSRTRCAVVRRPHRAGWRSRPCPARGAIGKTLSWRFSTTLAQFLHESPIRNPSEDGPETQKKKTDTYTYPHNLARVRTLNNHGAGRASLEAHVQTRGQHGKLVCYIYHWLA